MHAKTASALLMRFTATMKSGAGATAGVQFQLQLLLQYYSAICLALRCEVKVGTYNAVESLAIAEQCAPKRLPFCSQPKQPAFALAAQHSRLPVCTCASPWVSCAVGICREEQQRHALPWLH